MKFLVLILDLDPRNENERYQEFPETYEEYENLGKRQFRKGFRECVNFRECEDRVLGYIQPCHIDEEFLLISVTNIYGSPSANENLNKIIGIQAGCRYEATGKKYGIPRDDVPLAWYDELKKKRKRCHCPLKYHYSCPSKYSLLFSEPIDNAHDVIFGDDIAKHPNPTGIDEKRIPAIMKVIDEHLSSVKGEGRKTELEKWNNIKNCIELPDLQEICNPEEFCYDDENERNKQFLELLEKVKSKKSSPYVEYKGKHFSRSTLVKRMALLRAGVKCEYCENDPPFFDKYGEPYFEVHHITPLSEGGKDDIDNVAALCPNCHRKIHLAEDMSRSFMKIQLEESIPKANKKMIDSNKVLKKVISRKK